ncbi:MAG: hypothetical protein A3F54_02970 [Candidatus Kerfeldbacteria bacterium RIFCSPHIGHO2_12_FULL_48_17]|uniref:Tyrosine specific protein phosphatases domain-containing protein n=1 Tax=Candidatus Kerfeldbacteria bacterium RIFCSPHIGHO2_12_FULL_48_17 TaxID=1798542 RepID=A0A1G2B9R2_9BACT|nr:MAG: hypothetical protein A3F54_02970 [Candidatus Kerfeldbacteria bacterium RIFCSPHIGHO2_12_FULL_48_17]
MSMRILYALLFLILPVYKALTFVALSVLRFFRRWRGKYHWFDRIDDHVWVGGAPLEYFGDLPYLQRQGITAIIHSAPEIPRYDWRAYKKENNFLFLRIMDRTSPTIAQLHTAVTWMNERIKRGEKVLIHCALGKGRSVCIAMAWYVYSRKMSADAALQYIQKHRPQAQPNHWQMRRMADFAEQLKSLSTISLSSRKIEISSERNED